MSTDPELSVLLVEDDEVDALTMRRSLRDLNVSIHVAGDGQEALDLLRGENGHDALPMPHVILLDLNMPRMNGHEFLDALRGDPVLRNRVVYVLTTSEAETDRNRAYDRQVAGYLVKGRVSAQRNTLRTLVESYRTDIIFPI